MYWNKTKILQAVDFLAKAEHNKADFFNSRQLQMLVMEMSANASSSATSCAKSSRVHHGPLADTQS